MQVACRQADNAFDVDPFVHDIDLAARNAVGDQPIAHGAADRQEAVDLGVLPARERVARDGELDAPRGDQRRPRTGAAIDSAVAAMATACGSCACTTSGRSCLRTRDSRHAAARSTSPRRRSGMRSRPSTCAAAALLGVRRRAPRGARSRAAPSLCSCTWLWPPRQARAVSMWRENTHNRSTLIRGAMLMFWTWALGLEGCPAAPTASRTSARRSRR